MADKEQQAYHPPAANGYTRGDEEAAADPRELRRQKQKKWALYIIAFIIFQSGIIALFSMTVMKFRTPKFRVRPASSFNTSNFHTTSTSFNLSLNAQFGIKNTNFGPYKYDNTTVSFFYRDTLVGTAVVRKSKADFRRTKKVNTMVDLIMSGTANSQLASDISSRVLSLRSTSRINGKVQIMFIFKKKKAADLNCTMNVNLDKKDIQDLICK